MASVAAAVPVDLRSEPPLNGNIVFPNDLALNEAIRDADVKSLAELLQLSVGSVLTIKAIADLTPAEDMTNAVRRWLDLGRHHRPPPLFDHVVLSWLARDAAANPKIEGRVAETLGDIATMHDNASGDTAPSSDDWRSIRRRTLDLADGIDMQLDKAYAELAASSAWPASASSSAVADTLRQWFLPKNGFQAERVSRNPNPQGPNAEALKAQWAAERRDRTAAMMAFLDQVDILLRDHAAASKTSHPTGTSGQNDADVSPHTLSDADLDALQKETDIGVTCARLDLPAHLVLSTKMIAGLAPSDSAKPFARRWLAAHARCPTMAISQHELLAWMVLDASQSFGVGTATKALLLRIAALHRSAANAPLAPDQWRDERRGAISFADAAQSIDRPCSELALVSAWSVADTVTVTSEAMQQWAMVRILDARARSGATAVDDQAMGALFKKIGDAEVAAGRKPKHGDVMVLLEASHPAEAASLNARQALDRETRVSCLSDLLQAVEALIATHIESVRP